MTSNQEIESYKTIMKIIYVSEFFIMTIRYDTILGFQRTNKNNYDVKNIKKPHKGSNFQILHDLESGHIS